MRREAVGVQKMPASHSLVEVLDRVPERGTVIGLRGVLLDLLGIPVEMLVLEETAATMSVDTFLKPAEGVGLLPAGGDLPGGGIRFTRATAG